MLFQNKKKKRKTELTESIFLLNDFRICRSFPVYRNPHREGGKNKAKQSKSNHREIGHLAETDHLVE